MQTADLWISGNLFPAGLPSGMAKRANAGSAGTRAVTPHERRPGHAFRRAGGAGRALGLVTA